MCSCLQENRTLNTGGRPIRGRLPRCVVLAPTRELANQVAREFESASTSIKVASFYGGVSIMGQVSTCCCLLCMLLGLVAGSTLPAGAM